MPPGDSRGGETDVQDELFDHHRVDESRGGDEDSGARHNQLSGLAAEVTSDHRATSIPEV